MSFVDRVVVGIVCSWLGYVVGINCICWLVCVWFKFRRGFWWKGNFGLLFEVFLNCINVRVLEVGDMNLDGVFFICGSILGDILLVYYVGVGRSEGCVFFEVG